MWTTAKVILNISLVRELGGVPGSFVYKMIILRLQLTFLQPEVFPAMESTGIEMLKKVRLIIVDRATISIMCLNFRLVDDFANWRCSNNESQISMTIAI